MTDYQYVPLNNKREEIRLMTIRAGSFSDDVQIQISKVSFTLNEPIPKFEALSYVWGDIEYLVYITVSPNSASPSRALAHPGRLGVSQNLALALPYLRHEHEDRVLWIDAICINQEDLEERSSQIERMGQIYNQAERVLAWVGPEESSSDNALKTLESLASKIVVDWPAQTLRSLSEEFNAWSDLSIPLPLHKVSWDAIYTLSFRPWFERLWVRQEIWLAKEATLIWGNSTIPWESFRKAIFCIYNKPRIYEAPGFWDRMELLETLINTSRGSHSLAYTIFLSRHSKCSDPRDRVYAMLGLINEDRSEWDIIPDYSKPVCEIYKNVAISYLSAFLDLGFLRFCDASARECGPELPSWAPDWRCLDAAAPSLPTYSAHGDASANLHFEGDSLHAQGITIGHVKLVVKIEMDSNTSYSDAVLDIQRFTKPHIPAYTSPQFQPLLDSLCRTLVVDDFGDPSDPPSSSVTEKDARAATSKMWTCAPADINASLTNDQVVRFYLDKAQWSCTRRALISISDGFLGLAPKSTESGDIVCVLLGCPNPLVLRPVTNKQKTFEVVGECYVDSMMKGQAFLGPLPDGIRQVSEFDDELGYHRNAFLDIQTSRTVVEDPRFASFLGEGYEERLSFEDCDGIEDENRVKIMEVMKVRGVELNWFEIV